ncbi:MAG: isocitrate lyase/phosphoenolpyruvate mutase family protein [Phycisphaerales bacterium]|nr:isocitrate lyase/phosphoenolpyruvate mutase family protein [Phycisphaerales bacterium]
MDNPSQVLKALAFRQLHDRTQVLLLPNAWDAMTARLLQKLNFPAIATTSGGIAWSLGYPDGEHAPFDEVIAVIGRIARAVSVPVTADIEAGYGRTPQEVAKTVRAVIDAGVVGINIEDSLHNPHVLREMEDASDRIRAARSAADAAGVPIVINARVDTYLVKYGQNDNERFDQTVLRAKAYLAAGADCIFPITLVDKETLKALVGAVDAPINVAAQAGMPNVAELRMTGVARLSTASRLATVALAAIERAINEFRETGRFESLEPAIPRPDVQRMMENN